MAQPVSQVLETEPPKKFPISWVDASMLSVAIIWGINFAVVKQTLSEISPMAFASLRFGLAAVFVALVLKSRGENFRIQKQDLWRVLVLGFLGITVCQTLFIQGIDRTTAGNASLLVGATPIFVTIFSLLLHLERIAPLGILGVVFSFTGTALIVGAGAGGLDFSSQTLIGNILILSSTCSWSLYTILSQNLMRRYSPLKITTLAMVTGTPLLVLLSASEIGYQSWRDVTVNGWMGVLYSFLLASAIAFVVWNNSIQKAGNTRTAIFSNLVPIVAVIVSWLFLNEMLRFWQIIGAVITLTGVTLTRLAPRKPLPR